VPSVSMTRSLLSHCDALHTVELHAPGTKVLGKELLGYGHRSDMSVFSDPLFYVGLF
jgi:hypothetical protein